MQEYVNTAKSNENADTSRFIHRIGSTIYSVGVYFKEGSKETLEEKMFRMIHAKRMNRKSGKYLV